MSFKLFVPYTPGKPSYSTRVSEDEWQKHESRIKKLHVSKETRGSILKQLEKDGFKPS